MSGRRERFPFVARDPAAGPLSLAPLVPLHLKLGAVGVGVTGLVDTGAAVSVIPWSVGARLAADWAASPPVPLAGNLAASEARGLVCDAGVGGFPPRKLVFAWSRSDAVPVLLGQMNFLLAFDVYLSRSAGWFELIEVGTTSNAGSDP